MRKLALSVRVLVGAVILFAMSSWAEATVVNVDLGPAGQTVYGLQGAYVTADAHFWNNGAAAGSPQTFSNLTASDGTTSTTWDVTVTIHSAIQPGVATNSLLGDFVYSYISLNATSGHLTLSGLTPNDSYQVYLYNSTSGQGERYIMGTASDFTGGTLQTVSGRPSSTNPSDITGANPAYTQDTDYTVFNLTADGTGNIYGLFLGPTDGDGGHLAGIQIISIPTPEPSSILLLMLGSIGFWSKARRFRTV